MFFTQNVNNRPRLNLGHLLLPHHHREDLYGHADLKFELVAAGLGELQSRCRVDSALQLCLTQAVASFGGSDSKGGALTLS